MLCHMLDEFAIKWRLAQGRRVAKDDQLHASSGDGYVHTAQIAEESDAAFVIASHHADEDDVTLLSLKTVDRIDRDAG